MELAKRLPISGNVDRSPRMENLPAHKKVQAQNTLSGILDAILSIASPASSMAAYSPEAEAAHIGRIFNTGDKVITKTGERGTVYSNRIGVDNKVSDPNSPWMKRRAELGKQASQGYLSGQLSFDQYSELFNTLIKRNEDQLRNLYKMPHPEGNDTYSIPKVLIEGESRPRTFFDTDIEDILGGPLGVITK